MKESADCRSLIAGVFFHLILGMVVASFILC